jgi:hypothetical protein
MVNSVVRDWTEVSYFHLSKLLNGFCYITSQIKAAGLQILKSYEKVNSCEVNKENTLYTANGTKNQLKLQKNM